MLPASAIVGRNMTEKHIQLKVLFTKHVKVNILVTFRQRDVISTDVEGEKVHHFVFMVASAANFARHFIAKLGDQDNAPDGEMHQMV